MSSDTAFVQLCSYQVAVSGERSWRTDIHWDLVLRALVISSTFLIGAAPLTMIEEKASSSHEDGQFRVGQTGPMGF
jgi:hypothetical protein